MSWIGDAMKTVEAVVLLRSKVEQLEKVDGKIDEEIRGIVRTLIQFDRRIVRLETIEEMRSGMTGPPRIADQ